MNSLYLISLGGLSLAAFTLVQAFLSNYRPPLSLLPGALAILVLVVSAHTASPIIDITRFVVALVVICACVERNDHHSGGHHA